jgi:hypothetical protein
MNQLVLEAAPPNFSVCMVLLKQSNQVRNWPAVGNDRFWQGGLVDADIGPAAAKAICVPYSRHPGDNGAAAPSQDCIEPTSTDAAQQMDVCKSWCSQLGLPFGPHGTSARRVFSVQSGKWDGRAKSPLTSVRRFPALFFSQASCVSELGQVL